MLQILSDIQENGIRELYFVSTMQLAIKGPSTPGVNAPRPADKEHLA